MSNFLKKSIICLITLFILTSCSNGNKGGKNENSPTTPEQQGAENSPSTEQSSPNDPGKDALNKDKGNASDSSTPQNKNSPTTPEQQGTENLPSSEQSPPNDSSTPHNDGVPTAPKKLEIKKAENSLGNTQSNINEQSTIKNLDKMSNKKKTKPTKKWNMQRRTVKKKKDEN